MVITLIGYRGCGKSSVAPLLAARLGWAWIDADVELERRAGCTIRDIFVAHGEPEFRRQEREILAELLGRDRLVLAAGGGAVMHEPTRERFRSAGPVVWLTAPAEVLFDRIHGDATTAARRPNLTSSGGLDEVRQLLASREPLYRECASIVCDASISSPEAIVDEIVSRLPQAVLDSASPGATT